MGDLALVFQRIAAHYFSIVVTVLLRSYIVTLSDPFL